MKTVGFFVELLVGPFLMRMTLMREFLFVLCSIIFASAALYGGEEVKRAAVPSWVKEAEFEIPSSQEGRNGSIRYLVADFQRHLEEETSYKQYAILIETEAGVEEYSQLSFSFQPEYQTLILHQIDIIRDGKVQDRLANAEIEVIRQEKGLDRQLYDGELTAHVILEDVRPGDVLSYSYSLVGENPVFAGHVHSFYRLVYGTEIGFLRRDIIWNPKKRTLQWQVLELDEEPVVEEVEGGLKILRWEREEVKELSPEEETPSWAIDYPWMEISDYGSWKDFGEWGMTLYQTDEALPENLEEVCDQIRKEHTSEEEIVVETLRWVQKNVRYLGSFLGEHTHQPHRLEDVERRRFGDCKDKGMMVVAMLRYLGFDAASAVVSTAGKKAVKRYLPG